MEIHEWAVNRFLKDKPEYIPDVKYIDGELCLNTDALIAFTDWTISGNVSGDLAKAKRFREALRQKFGR